MAEGDLGGGVGGARGRKWESNFHATSTISVGKTMTCV